MKIKNRQRKSKTDVQHVTIVIVLLSGYLCLCGLNIETLHRDIDICYETVAVITIMILPLTESKQNSVFCSHSIHVTTKRYCLYKNIYIHTALMPPFHVDFCKPVPCLFALGKILGKYRQLLMQILILSLKNVKETCV